MFKIKGIDEPFINSDDFFKILSDQNFNIEKSQQEELKELLAFNEENKDIFVVSKLLLLLSELFKAYQSEQEGGKVSNRKGLTTEGKKEGENDEEDYGDDFEKVSCGINFLG